MSRSFSAAVLTLFMTATVGLAQDSQGSMSLELNKATATTSGGCQLVFLGHNGMSEDFEEVTWRLAVFGADGVFRNLLALPLNALSPGKRRVVQFSLPYACEDLSDIIVNEVASCKIAGSEEDLGEACLTGLTVSSRTEIAFGL
ncbi:MAG: hypothetical protein GJ676_08790 [Rhodobacteraceae bacterium]|nr:hypothetical protein [Paracoccaceae bacterium]